MKPGELECYQHLKLGEMETSFGIGLMKLRISFPDILMLPDLGDRL